MSSTRACLPLLLRTTLSAPDSAPALARFKIIITVFCAVDSVSLCYGMILKRFKTVEFCHQFQYAVVGSAVLTVLPCLPEWSGELNSGPNGHTHTHREKRERWPRAMVFFFYKQWASIMGGFDDRDCSSTIIILVVPTIVWGGSARNGNLVFSPGEGSRRAIERRRLCAFSIQNPS
ncbi:hypothetical protein RRG08_043059 [Elysia crispata]|uniref:Uncharacterized protein n=1 Tax=Elysia crispata TaxID=231223 RepID=A0AAE0XY01_9GAST|nr:hypothetical protein RRG08_043059 [Elysia crispata]